MDLKEKFALHSLMWEPKELPSIPLPKWDIDNLEVLYLYGLGDGAAYDALVPWLRENGERKLVILEEDGGIIAAHLQKDSAFLSDPQVDLEWGCPLKELAERYPAKRIEVIALQETPKFKKIRLQLLRHTTLSYSLFIDRLHGYQTLDNFLQNMPHLKDAFYANGLKGAFAGVPAIVCGAGPSLQQAIPLLKQLEDRAIIIAGGSAIAALSSAGIIPHFAMAIDPNLEEYRRMRNSFAFECPFLFSTRLFPGVFRTCNGPFGYMRSGIGGVPELWLEEELGLTDPLLGEMLSDDSISVTAIAIAFAEHIGCTTIALSGVDLAYTDGKRYASGVSDEATCLSDSHKSAPDRILRKKDKQGKFVHTAVRWVMEASSISHYAKSHPQIRWINTTEGGLPIKGLEAMSLEAAMQLMVDRSPLKERIAAEIAKNPMPLPKTDLVLELKESLERMIGHLEVLAGEKKGPAVLAELDMKEELVASIFFYDMEKVLNQARCGEKKWPLYLETARKYMLMFQ